MRSLYQYAMRILMNNCFANPMGTRPIQLVGCLFASIIALPAESRLGQDKRSRYSSASRALMLSLPAYRVFRIAGSKLGNDSLKLRGKRDSGLFASLTSGSFCAIKHPFKLSSIALQWLGHNTCGHVCACVVAKAATWLILPVVICLSQRLSHACLSINCFIL